MNRRKNRSPRDLQMDRRRSWRAQAPHFVFGIFLLIAMSLILAWQKGII